MNRARRIRIVILLALGVGIVALLMARGRGPAIEPGSTLVIELAGEYVEAQQSPLIARVMGDARRPFVSLLSSFNLAKRDDRIETVVIKHLGAQLGWGQAQEVREAIGRLREAGKKTVSYLELASFSASRDYYIASAADEVIAPPGALIPVLGLAAEYLFLGGVWEKLGIEVESERIGRFKSAVDSYTGTGMSDSHREMATALLDSLNDQFVSGIASGRGLEVATVRRAIDAGPVVPSELRELGLIDHVMHLDDHAAMSAPQVTASEYAGVDPASVGFEPVANFALIYGSGTVVSGDGGRSPGRGPVFASGALAKAMEAAAEDPEIDAVILRIDSPGGSSLASEMVWQAMQKLRETGKPLIASLADVAASGGYYAAVGADRIVADPAVLTGSIGVFVLRPVLGGLFDKLGIGVESLTRGAHADFLLSAEPMSPGAQERLRTLVVDTYDLFVSRVAESRNMPASEVDALGQGRVWTGAEALERGLVDELGGLHTAVAAGRRALGLDPEADVALVPLPAASTLADQLQDVIRGQVSVDSLIASQLETLALLRLPLPTVTRTLGAWAEMLPARSPLLIPPLLLEIH